MPSRLCFFCSGLLLLTTSTAQAGAEPENLPLASPFSALSLQMAAPRSEGLKAGEWALRASLSHSNVFILSDWPKGYLEFRGHDEPISAEDGQRLFAGFSDEFYYLDGEFSQAHVWLEYGVSDSLSAYLDINGQANGGGVFDGLIEGFHDVFGFGSADRDIMERDQFQAALRLGRDEVLLLEPDKRSGLGDPVLGLRYGQALSDVWRLELQAAAKLSTQDASYFYASGDDDVGLQASLAWAGENQHWLFSAHAIQLGDSPLFPSSLRERLYQLRVDHVYRWSRDLHILTAITGTQSLFDPGKVEENLADDSYQASISLRFGEDAGYYSLGLSENLVNLDTSADLSLHVAVGMEF
ncbi:MAG: DUF3187 family protein [Gammaproteobacteria bacterium]|nr:DUF3187 family protein [Gammaproteobacteria bacterium]